MSRPDAEDGVPVAFRTLGCKVNRVESEGLAADLLGRGARIVDEREAAVVVINTCTVTGEADAKARKAVRQALGGPSRPIVVVTGCLAALDAAGLRSLGERLVVEADKAQVAARTAELLGLGEAHHGPTPRDPQLRTRAMLKIEDGCDNFCSYCIVPYARGVPRGTPLVDVAAAARRLVASDVREVVLTGINIGRYRDEESGADLADLIGVVADAGLSRLRLSSIEPPDLTPRLLTILAETPALCEHLHVPLQSGSDAVLSAMGRKYSAGSFAERIEAARSAIPALAVTTDVIAGFPGEAEEDHAETLAFADKLGFSKLHVFRYSARPGTPAAALPQVDPKVRARRAAELRGLGTELRERYIAARSGERAEVLVESVHGSRAVGTTREYLRVALSSAGVRVGTCVDVTIGSPGIECE